MARKRKTVAERVKTLLPNEGDSMLVSELRRRLRVTRDEIEGCVHDTSGLDLIVGLRTGAGHAHYGKRQWRIERYE